MVKCFKCTKTVTKKSPGVQCGKCSKWIHGVCASITTEQLNALVATDSVDWKCRNCTGGVKPKRLSCILPDAEEEDNTDNESLSNMAQNKLTQKILNDIRREVRDIITSELQSTLQFYSDKIDEYEEKIAVYECNIKMMEDQCQDLKHSVKNAMLKYEILEQKMNAMEQSQMCNFIEICGVKEAIDENPLDIASKICSNLQLNPKTILKAYRKTGKKSRTTAADKEPSPPILVAMQEGCRDKWLEAARTIQLNNTVLGSEDISRINVREALTPSSAFMLWKAKKELKETGICKFIWFKNGQILSRKEEKEKIFTVRSISDIERLKLNMPSKST
ncbi:hypothetical protein JYU34_016313 [Plutella xylostella]|uniref:PHD-type domain-containing protein n=1 Tax=Plutella xylostella TaxID=51655 RepID=A0ABQ7Q369_PLUXY|nr:hypothetical protein JYU34_016313 [Plutella xylostella]